jgi:very-short-patch-repair endonuclease
MRNHVRSAEHRANIAAAKRGDANPAKRPEVREKIRAAFTPEKRRAISESLQGHAVSDETRAKIREARLAQDPQPQKATKPEQMMAALLLYAGVEFEIQRRIARYIVDFYLPTSGAVVEVDGAYWHPDGPNMERDAVLIAAGVSAVHHVTDVQLRERGWL